MLTTILNILIAGLIMGGIYTLIAVGLNMQWGVTRVLNMSHGEFIMLGAFAAYFLYKLANISPLISLVIVPPVFFGIGFLLHRTLFLSLLKSSESMATYEISSLLAGYGLMFILANFAALVWGSSPRAYSYLSDSISLFGSSFSLNRVVALVISVGLSLLCYLFLAHTRLGKAIRATSQDIEVARLMGIDVNRVLGFCFGLGTALAAIAAVLISMMFSIRPFMGVQYLVITFIVVVLGGLGNIMGSLVAGFILGVVGSAVTYFQPGLVMVSFFMIFVIILLFKPNGIFGK